MPVGQSENHLAGLLASRYVSGMKIVFANTKGGVGKSTLAVHAAVWLHDHGVRVAVLDLDKQRSSSVWIAEAEPKITVRTADTPEECLSEALALAQSHDFVVADGPGGMDDLSRTLLLLADAAIFPITPSILDLRSVQGATSILQFAQQINGGRPYGRLILNKMKSRETTSRELKEASHSLGLVVVDHMVRDLQAFRDAAQQGTVVTRMGSRAAQAAADIDGVFDELLGDVIEQSKQVSERNREVGNG
jgi:chromosome partitioning protein